MTDATLLVIQGPDQGRRFELTDHNVTLGRGSQNDIRFLDTEVSRRHAVLAHGEQGWQITDLDSANGTYVNGKAVNTALVRPGDQVQIGRTILLITSDPDVTEPAAVERISLIARSSSDDQSRIVGQARALETVALSSWAQAGANLQLLYQISEESVRPASSLDDLLSRILDLTLQAVGADRGCMLVANSRTDRIEPRVVSHRSHVDVNERMPISTSIVEYVIQNGQGVRTSDAQHDSRFESGQSIMKSGIREAMCVPMQGRYELMGVIYVDTTTASHLSDLTTAQNGQFSDQLLRLLLAIGRQSALAIENYRYQEALVTSERLAAVGQTIAILSHHIKNILQGVRGGGYLIDMGLKQKDDELIRKGWGVVDRNQQRIYDLVMDLLTFGKEREPRLVISRLPSLIEDVAELIQTRAQEAQIDFQVRVDESIPESQFDPEGIHRAVLNLLTNAVEALDETPSPRIELRAGFDSEQDLLWVEVEDNGPGIPEEERLRLFSLFESSKGAKGTGLGLAVSRKILQEHGGEIDVRSEVGVGTCFRLSWPFLLEEHEAGDDRDDDSEHQEVEPDPLPDE